MKKDDASLKRPHMCLDVYNGGLNAIQVQQTVSIMQHLIWRTNCRDKAFKDKLNKINKDGAPLKRSTHVPRGL